MYVRGVRLLVTTAQPQVGDDNEGQMRVVYTGAARELANRHLLNLMRNHIRNFAIYNLPNLEAVTFPLLCRIVTPISNSKFGSGTDLNFKGIRNLRSAAPATATALWMWIVKSPFS